MAMESSSSASSPLTNQTSRCPLHPPPLALTCFMCRNYDTVLGFTKIMYVFCPAPFPVPLQFPRQITLDLDSDFVLCAEIMGWFMYRLQVENGDWLMMVEEDSMLSLTTHLMIRGPNAINVVTGVPHTAEYLTARDFAHNCVKCMKDITLMPYISFGRVVP